MIRRRPATPAMSNASAASRTRTSTCCPYSAMHATARPLRRGLLCLLLVAVLRLSSGGWGVGAHQGDTRDESQKRGERPARFYQWPLSQLAGAGAGSRWDHHQHPAGQARGPESREPAMRSTNGEQEAAAMDSETLGNRAGQPEAAGEHGARHRRRADAQLDFSGMRYWKKGLAAAQPEPLPLTDKFLSFEPWIGGFNNVRMSLEYAVALAIATNRTLVLPDKSKYAGLPGENNTWSVFYNLEDMARGVPVMHQQDFAAKFNLPNPDGRIDFPKAPGSWGQKSYIANGWQGIFEISKSYGFGEDELKKSPLSGVIFCVPDCPKPNTEFHDDFAVYTKGKLPSVSTSTWDTSQIVHFSKNGLGLWYTTIFIRPKLLDVNHKLAMKTYCHLDDHIFDMAEKVLRKLLSDTPSFSSMHIRRGDFQFKDVLTPVEEIIANTKALFHEGEDIWVMTQEKNPREFFAEMEQHYKLHFMSDYMSILDGVSPALLPMIESVICARARIFSGTFKSTLTGYINRLRGYMDDIEDKQVYFNQMLYPDAYGQDWDNKYPTWIYAKGIKPGGGIPNWSREYREAWDTEWDLSSGSITAKESVPETGTVLVEESRKHAQLDFSGMRYWTKGLAKAQPDPLPVTDRFLSFEPWLGGFNNVRMSLEYAMALAIATNRTLVLPDKNKYAGLPGENNTWSVFYNLEDMARGVPIMHQKDFAAKFNLPNPDGRTDFPKAPGFWGQKSFIGNGWQGIFEISKSYGFGEDELKKSAQSGIIYCIPECPEPKTEFHDEFLVYTKGRLPSLSTSTWESSQIVHFSQNGLGLWYTSIFIRPKLLDLWHKLAMKAHCHLNDHIFDMAEKVLRKLLSDTPSFSCMHIRRGDFQFKDVLTPVDDIISNTKGLFYEGEHMWVMSQEKKPHEYFGAMRQHYNLHFMTDYITTLDGVNPALLPMIESVICSRARVFSGTFKSTLTGYIHRLRGYMDDIGNKNVYFNQMLYPDEYGRDWDNKYPTWIHARGIKPGEGVPGWSREYREVWDTEWDIIEGSVW